MGHTGGDTWAASSDVIEADIELLIVFANYLQLSSKLARHPKLWILTTPMKKLFHWVYLLAPTLTL